MAKKRIQNYVFLPGVAKSSSAYPNAYSLIESNLNFIKKEAVAYISSRIGTETAANLSIRCLHSRYSLWRQFKYY